ncbi:PGN_0703 family putative restriction endonuclease [uncultured Draconibacterium sp.]|uniref:PGN_0703 family putative restriction endonuclease n=1 Tax=uncultured Draconibacterium sp. TaxID=1573823 RepID=UPI002AA7C2C9|nr:hypothetical protein [uncultured Draconibacterium sp.]
MIEKHPQRFSKYRKEVEEYATNYFASKRYPVGKKSKYILDKRDNWCRNIILDSVHQYIANEKEEAKKSKISFPLHKYIHHGLSSQAMLFNLFGEPLINQDYVFFQDVFQFSDIKLDEKYELKFEHYNRNTFKETTQQPTSFDFAVFDSTGEHRNIFIEAKYVEREFGGCSSIESGECDGLNPVNNHDSCYLTQKGRTYWQLMKKHGLDQPYQNCSICPFAIYYQFFRELMFALENNGYFVLLIDKRNPAFEKSNNGNKRGLISVLLNQIPQKLHYVIKVLYIQDVLPILEKHGYSWVGEFREKYGM